MSENKKPNPKVKKIYIIFQRGILSNSPRNIVGFSETEELAHAKIDEIQKRYADQPITLFYHEEFMEVGIRDVILSALNPTDEYGSSEGEGSESEEGEYPWYVERWYEDDIINGLESLRIYTGDLTREQMHILRYELKDVFDNKEDRNILLQDTLDMLKDKYDWLYSLDEEEYE